MKNSEKPSLLLVTFISGLPLFSETVYAPSLPEIAHFFNTSENMAEHTLTIYLVAFALGILLWGKLSDTYGRKNCILGGFFVYLLGCVGCFVAPTIGWFMAARFVQAFGGSVGSVLGQAVVRDAFVGKELGKAYAAVGSSLAVFPAIGPIVGGYIAQYFFWKHIFTLLIGVAIAVMFIIAAFLPETHPVENRKDVLIFNVLKRMIKDPFVIGLGLLVAASNGIRFSYFAEGSFYFIEMLGLQPSMYGKTFIGVSLAGILAGFIAHRLHAWYSSMEILQYGLFVVVGGGLSFLSLVIAAPIIIIWSKFLFIFASLFFIMCIMCGLVMVTSTALPMALVKYTDVLGTASSLFGFGYYGLVSIFTFGMGFLHNETMIVMPLYFVMIGFLQLIIFYKIVVPSKA